MSFCPISPPREREREKKEKTMNEQTNDCCEYEEWMFESFSIQWISTSCCPIYSIQGRGSLSPLLSPFLLFIPYRCTDGWVLLVLFSLNVFVIARVSFVFLLLLLVGLAWYGLAWCLWLCVSNLTNTHSHFTKPNLTCLLIPGLWSNYNKNSNDKNNRSVCSHGIIMIFPVSVCTSVCKYVLVWCPSFIL